MPNITLPDGNKLSFKNNVTGNNILKVWISNFNVELNLSTFSSGTFDVL